MDCCLHSHCQKNKKSNPSQAGFTLLELLFVIALIGILASVAVGQYSRHIQQSNRRAAVVELYAAQQSLERIRLQTGAYNSQTLAVPTVKGYTFEFTVDTNTYKLKAIAGQGDDTTCGDLSIDQVDLRQASAGAVKECWE